MQIKLVDGTTYTIEDIKIESSTLYIEFTDKSAEEVKTIISQPDNLGKIILLEDNTGDDLAYYSNYTVFAGVLITSESKIVGMLNQEKSDELLRIEAVEINAGTAITIANEAKAAVSEMQSSVSDVTSSISTLSDTVSDTAQIAQQSAKPAMLSLAAARIIAQDFEDEDAITVKDIYPTYEECIGKTVNQGFKMTHEDVLYKVIQASLLIQAQYVPGAIGTESLYTVIDEVHQGTQEDPIPYFGNMELENGKYYTQNNTLYHCIRDTEQPVYHNLADLVGLYVETA